MIALTVSECIKNKQTDKRTFCFIYLDRIRMEGRGTMNLMPGLKTVNLIGSEL